MINGANKTSGGRAARLSFLKHALSGTGAAMLLAVAALLSAAVLLSSGALVNTAAAQQVTPQNNAANVTNATDGQENIHTRMRYVVKRGEEEAGTHTLEFRGSHQRLTVTAQTRATMRVFGLFNVPFAYDSLAVWRNGALLSLSAVMKRGGIESRYHVAKEGAHYRNQDGDVASPPLFPTNHWKRAAVQRKVFAPAKRRLFNTLNGKFIEVDITPPREERLSLPGRRSVDAMRYTLSGDLEIVLWYDARDRWMQMQFSTLGATYQFIYAGSENIDEGG